MAALRSTIPAVATRPTDAPTIPAVTPNASSRRLRPNSTQEKPPTPRMLRPQKPRAALRLGLGPCAINRAPPYHRNTSIAVQAPAKTGPGGVSGDFRSRAYQTAVVGWAGVGEKLPPEIAAAPTMAPAIANAVLFRIFFRSPPHSIVTDYNAALSQSDEVGHPGRSCYGMGDSPTLSSSHPAHHEATGDPVGADLLITILQQKSQSSDAHYLAILRPARISIRRPYHC
jgi:hypothetical protein